MNGFLIFLVVALWFGLSIRKAYHKQLSELGSEAASDAGTVKNAFESLFDESGQAEEVNYSTSFAKEAASAGYYSYEGATSTTDSRVAAKSAMSAQSPRPFRPTEPKTAVQAVPDATAFDLRQAVIYQTILTNKYLQDTQTSDN